MEWLPMIAPDASQAAPDAGQYLTALCRESGRTQAAIASQIGMGEVTFRKYLNGTRKTASTIYLLQYAVEGAVGAKVVRRVRRAFGIKMPRS